MQLVEFNDAQGLKVWINPGQVASVKPHAGTQDVTDLHLSCSTTVRVAGRPADVARRLSEAMKM